MPCAGRAGWSMRLRAAPTTTFSWATPTNRRETGAPRPANGTGPWRSHPATPARGAVSASEERVVSAPVMSRSFGRYELLERIGIGGMAEVFKAMHRGVGGFERL